MAELVIATGNPHKVEELRAIFASSGLEVVLLSLAELPGSLAFQEPAETGSTFEENARIKARSYAAQTGRVCLADDSGLEIDALHGRPGVISSHYASDGRETGLPRERRDAENNARVLRELRGVPTAQRGARFVCTMCVANPEGRVLATSRGTFEGRIGRASADPEDAGDDASALVPRGSNGFGYDPLFLVAPEYAVTSAELSPAEKNRLSHRAAAANQIARELRILLASGAL